MDILASKLSAGFQVADVIVTTGGASMGDKVTFIFVRLKSKNILRIIRARKILSIGV